MENAIRKLFSLGGNTMNVISYLLITVLVSLCGCKKTVASSDIFQNNNIHKENLTSPECIDKEQPKSEKNGRSPNDPSLCSSIDDIFSAAKNNCTEVITKILSLDKSAVNRRMNSKDSVDLTPLILSVQENNIEAATLLLNYGADVDNTSQTNCAVDGSSHWCGDWGYSALNFASQNRSLKLVDLLLNHHADPNIITALGFSPLLNAGNNIAIIDLLVKAGARIDGRVINSQVVDNNCSTVDHLISLGANVNSGISPDTPIVVASMLNHASIIHLLMKKNANPYISGYVGSALSTAIHYSNVEAVQALLEEGVNPNWFNCETNHDSPVIFAAAQSSKSDILVPLLIRFKTEINLKACDKFLETPLMLASTPQAAQSLIDAGSDVNARDYDGNTPLLKNLRDAKVVEILINHGADVNARDLKGNTPLLNLMRTSKYKEISQSSIENIVEQLLSHGADGKSVNKDGMTTLMAAVMSGSSKLVEKFILIGNTLNQNSTFGTALMYAMTLEDEAKRSEITNILIKYGADIHLQNANGENALSKIIENILHKNSSEFKEVQYLLGKGIKSSIQYNTDYYADGFGPRTPLIITLYMAYGYSKLDAASRVTQMLLENGADPNFQSSDGKCPLKIAQRFAPSLVDILVKYGAKDCTRGEL